MFTEVLDPGRDPDGASAQMLCWMLYQENRATLRTAGIRNRVSEVIMKSNMAQCSMDRSELSLLPAR